MVEDEYEMRVPREEKTDWKNDIRRALVSPSFAYNQEDFMKRVESCIDIVACSYPNWDAHQEIKKDVDKIILDFRNKFKKWRLDNEPTKRHRRYLVEKQHQLNMHKKIWEFLKNYCARHGMLVEGPRDSRAIPYEVKKDES